MMKIKGSVMSTPDSIYEDDEVVILSDNFPCKFVTNIVRETNPIAFLFIGTEGKLEEGSLGLTLLETGSQKENWSRKMMSGVCPVRS